MRTWWNGTDVAPEIDGEHRDLYQVMARLELAIVGSEGEQAIIDAVEHLRQRMAEHFQYEERVAGNGHDAAGLALLRRDHGRSLGILARLGHLPPGADLERIRAYGDFVESLKNHDACIDRPVFRGPVH